MNITTVVAIGVGALGPHVLFAADFADDFSLDFVNLDYRVESQNLVPDSVPATFEAGLLSIEVIDTDPTDDERGEFSIRPTGILETLESSVTTGLQRPATGRIGYGVQGRFYNSIVDGGPAQNDPSLDSRFGDVNVYVELYLHADPTQDNFLYCFENRTADGGFATAVPGMDACGNLQIVPELATTYTMAVGVDKTTGQMFVRVNDEEIRVNAPTPMFQVASDFYQVRARVRDGAATARFNINSIATNNGPIELATIAEERRYRSDDFDNFDDDPSRSRTLVDGRLRLSASNDSIESDNDAFLRLDVPTNYLEAEMEYSSESVVDLQADGFTAVRIAGGLYSEISPENADGNTGAVFASVMLIENVGTGLVGEYCLIRSDTPDFSVTTDLADGMDDGRCPEFATAVDFDTTYKASLSLDRQAGTVSFQLGDEVQVVAIQSEIFDPPFNLRAQARIADGATGTVVGHFDNLRTDPDALTDEEINALANSGSSSSSGGSSGGGCTLRPGNADMSTLVLLILTVVGLVIRRRKAL